jgi:hypothetical protein
MDPQVLAGIPEFVEQDWQGFDSGPRLKKVQLKQPYLGRMLQKQMYKREMLQRDMLERAMPPADGYSYTLERGSMHSLDPSSLSLNGGKMLPIHPSYLSMAGPNMPINGENQPQMGHMAFGMNPDIIPVMGGYMIKQEPGLMEQNTMAYMQEGGYALGPTLPSMPPQ